MKNRKSNFVFSYIIWQILKRFDRTFRWAQTLKLGGVLHSISLKKVCTTLRNQEKVQGVHVNLVPRGKAVWQQANFLTKHVLCHNRIEFLRLRVPSVFCPTKGKIFIFLPFLKIFTNVHTPKRKFPDKFGPNSPTDP